MPESVLWTFFYGSFINLDVLRHLNLVPERYEVAKLNGFDICIQPLANVVRSDQHSVYGIVATATHRELYALYAYAQTGLGGTYLPEAVMVETLGGLWRPALCYVAPSMEPGPTTNDYLDRIIKPAQAFGFPEWYIERLNSFRCEG